MDAQTPKATTQSTAAQVSKASTGEAPKPVGSSVPAIIVGVVIAAIAGLSIWYLVRPAPLLVQGEVDATGSTSPRGSTGASRDTGRARPERRRRCRAR